ncbi:MAG TPA: helix-turn-helix transcriptional regulator [Streptosporangiaceae bacterium]|nr:helix-turn-helix transcriptional regulator [Streptosporangiaceae bacterium]
MPSERGVGGDIRQFLITRRDRLTPGQAGLPDYGGRRRVSGLRREEVALLAGISIEYYTRLERGNARGVSDEVIERLARALQLDEVERGHLFDLVRAASTAPGRGRQHVAPTGVRRSVQQALDAMTSAAAFVRNARLDVLSANQLGSALYCQLFDNPGLSANLARFVFLDPRATKFYRDWDRIAHDAAGSLRSQAGRNPRDQALAELIDDLSARSGQFRTRWAAHNVSYYRTGTQPFHHPVAGDLDLDFDALEVAADPGLTIVAYTAPPGSASRSALRQLASRTANDGDDALA